MIAQLKDTALFKRVFDHSSEAVVVLDMDSKIIGANPAFMRLYGYARDEIIGQKLADHIDKADRMPLLADLMAIKDQKTTLITANKKDGDRLPLKLKWISIPQKEQAFALAFVVPPSDHQNGTTPPDHSAAPVVSTKNSLDIRKRALNAAGNGILIADALDPELPIIFSNPAFSRMTGYRNSEVLGRNCRFLQNGDRDQPALKKLRKALKKGDACKVLLRNYRKDGSMFWND